jgi:tetratricopeptide (TPR) repeat protein
VAAHLVAAGALADDEPETAWRHARAARARGGRIGVVRETVGLVAYRAGEWAEAIGELRAARRMGGGPGHLAVMADCERALGHPEKAIELSRSAEADELDPEAATELSIVVAGARADLGQVDAALAQLERLGLDKAEEHPRLAYAYADLLLKSGRSQEALSWFIRSANADTEEETDALDRVEALSEEETDEQSSDQTSAADGDLASGAMHTDDVLEQEVEVPGDTVADVEVTAPTTDTELTTPDLTQPDLAQPDLAQPDLAQPELAQPGLVEPDLTGPELTEPHREEPHLSEPHPSAPELAEPGTAEPDSVLVDNAVTESLPSEDNPSDTTPDQDDESRDGFSTPVADEAPPLLFSDDPQAGDR